MPSYDVKFPREQKVVFADRCIVCETPEPGFQTRVRRTSSSWWGFLFPFLHIIALFDGHTVHVPACRSCAIKLHAQSWWRWLAMALILGVFLWLGGEAISHLLPRPLAKWVTIGGALVCLIPWAYWHVYFPLPFGMTVEEHEVEYEFRDQQAAMDFITLNSIRDLQEQRQLLAVIATRDQLRKPHVSSSSTLDDFRDPRFDR